MKKDFDTWNKQKKAVHDTGQNKWCNERDIWWCKLGTNIGFEQDGKGSDFSRPVLIIRKFGIHTALVAPLTTSKKISPFYVSIGDVLNKESSIIITQIRLIDTKRLDDKRGRLSVEQFDIIRKAIKDLL